MTGGYIVFGSIGQAVLGPFAAFVVIAAMGLQGVRKVQLQLGESAMVIGLGLLGVFATQMAALDGAIPEIVSPEDAPEIYTRLAEAKHPPLGIVFDWERTR